MKIQIERRKMTATAELLEQLALNMRGAHLRWNGQAYSWPASARREKRLHDRALDVAGELRRAAQ